MEEVTTSTLEINRRSEMVSDFSSMLHPKISRMGSVRPQSHSQGQKDWAERVFMQGQRWEGTGLLPWVLAKALPWLALAISCPHAMPKP